MAASIVTLAKELTDFINSVTLPLAVTAERLNRVREDLSDVQELNVWVVPASEAQTTNTRGSDYLDLRIHVAVANTLGYEDNIDADIDTMLNFTDTLKSAIMRENFSDDVYQYMGMENDPIYNATQVDGENMFMTVIVVTYRTLRTQEFTLTP